MLHGRQRLPDRIERLSRAAAMLGVAGALVVAAGFAEVPAPPPPRPCIDPDVPQTLVPGQQQGEILIPDSSTEKPGDVGNRPHTNYEIFNRGRCVTLPPPPGNHPPD